jgi:hypothetical protein
VTLKRNQMKAFALAIACSLSAAGCSSHLVKSLAAINALRQHLTERYHDEVAVNVQNSRFLTVSFINSELNKQNPNKRWDRAEDAARFVVRNYEEIRSVEQIRIAFVETQSGYIVINYSRIIGSYGFDRNGVALGLNSGSEDLRAPVVRYNESADQTDVSITRIQLEGNMTKGVALVPHFQVNGDARQPGSDVPPPGYVIFDFASYSDTPQFSGNAPLQIDCDGRPLVKGFAQLMPGDQNGTNDTVAQFLSVRMTFKALNRIAHAHNVAITLGPKHFQLAPDDMEALARMTTYVAHAEAESP